MLRGGGAGQGSSSHLSRADDAPAPGPRPGALAHVGISRQELALGARPAGPRGSRDRGGARPSGGSRKGSHPDRTRVSHRRISPWQPYLVRPGYAGSAQLPSPRAHGVCHPKGRTTTGAGGDRLCSPPGKRTMGRRTSTQALRRLGLRIRCWHQHRARHVERRTRARPDGPAHAR